MSSSDPHPAPTTLVVGGGVSGLIYAYERARSGDEVTVLESADHVGGAVWSHIVGDVEANTGAEAFAIGQGHVASLVSELGLDPVVVSPASGTSFIVSDHGAYASPTNAIFGMPARSFAPDVRAALGLTGALRSSLERFLPTSYAVSDSVTVGDFVRRRYGSKVLERLVAPIIHGVHSADPEKLELRAVMPQLASKIREAGSAHKAIEAMLVARGTRKGSGAAVHSLSPSMAELPKALAAAIETHGGRVLTSHAVTRVAKADARHAWAVTALVRGDARETFTADRLVLAVGPEEARGILHKAAPEIAHAIPVAPATPVRLATLVLDNPELDAKPRGNGVLVAPGTTKIRAKAMTHASAKWEHVGAAARAQRPGRHVVRLSYGRGAAGDLPHPSVFPQLAVSDAAKILGLQASALHLADWALTDWSGTMRQSGPGHTAALAALADTLEELTQRSGSPLPFLELTGAWRAGNGLEAITRVTRKLAQEGPRS